MAHETRWADDTQTIILTTYNGRLTWDGVYDSLKDITALTRTVEHRVDFVGDFRQATPPPLGNLIKFKPMYDDSPPNGGIGVAVGMVPFGKTMLNMFITLYAKIVKQNITLFANDLEEAYRLIAKERAKSDKINMQEKDS